MTETAAPPILLCTRFGLGIRDPAWFEHRLALTAAITVPSILSQRDKNLHWVWLVDKDLSTKVRGRIEEMLAPFSGRAFLESNRHFWHLGPRQLAQDRDLIDRSGRMLTARIDDDDAWSIDTVGAVRLKVAEWKRRESDAKGLGITFDHGLEWIMYDMLDIDRLQQHGRRVVHPAAVREYTYPFHSMSTHVYASVSSGITALSDAHSRMGRTLGQHGCTVDIVSTNEPMWLYCRHKQIDSSVKKARGETVDLTLHDLADRFGIDEEKTASYLEASDDHGYATLKRPPAEFGRIKRKISDVRKQLHSASGTQIAHLEEKERRLSAELSHLSENIVGEPGEVDELIDRDTPG